MSLRDLAPCPNSDASQVAPELRSSTREAYDATDEPSFSETIVNSPSICHPRNDSSSHEQSLANSAPTPTSPNSVTVQQLPVSPPTPLPRRSSRTNRGVPPLRLHDDSMYGRD